MEAKTSKAQMEVWEWKEKLSEELKKVPLSDQQKYIREKTRAIVAKLKVAKGKRDKTQKSV